MFDFLLVYPAAFLIGLLSGLIVVAKTGRRQAAMALVAGLVGALIAISISMGFLDARISLADLLTQLALPAAGICLVLGFIGTYLGTTLRAFVRWLATFIVETFTLK